MRPQNGSTALLTVLGYAGREGMWEGKTRLLKQHVLEHFIRIYSNHCACISIHVRAS